MKVCKLYDTNMPNMYETGLFNEYSSTLSYNHTDKIIDVTLTAMANLLNSIKSKDRPAVFRFDRIDGSMVAAGIVQYFESEDKDEPGNWSLTMTFEEKDLPADAEYRSNKDPMTHTFFRSAAGDKYNFTYNTPDAIIFMSNLLLEDIRKWLDENAKENEEVALQCDGLMTARVAIEGGEKVFSIELDGEIKMLVKDDAAIEK